MMWTVDDSTNMAAQETWCHWNRTCSSSISF